MFNYKNYLKGLLIAVPVTIAATGCKKFIDREPLSATVNDIRVGALEGKALGLYGAIRNSKTDPYCGDGFQSIPWIAMNGFRSDDAEIVSDPGASAWHQTYDNFQYTKDDWGAGLYWDKHYIFIGLCNDALNEAQVGGYTDPASLINIGEAKFFRAYSYFDLVRTFGDVPKIDFKINDPAQGQIAKSSAAEIYALIEADLNAAIGALPLTWEPKYKGRLTSGAAKTLLAKVLLQEHKYSQALPLLQEVIASNQYSLVTPYWKIFKKEGELGAESIFEIQASKVAGDGDTYWNRLGQAQGVRGSGQWDLGWGWNTPSESLVSSYEDGDVRKAATILYSGQSDGGTDAGGYGQLVPNLTNAAYWNKKVYNPYSDYLAAGLGTPNNEAQNTWVNQRVLRYADVLLMAAEALNETSGSATAIVDLINQIRNRAGLANYSGATTQAGLRAEILKQRRAEFAMEFERFWDLVRSGTDISVLGPNGYQTKHRLFPIPTSAINANPQLTQNPDWP